MRERLPRIFWFAVAVGGILVGLYWYLVHIPLTADCRAVRAEVETKRQKLQILEKYLVRHRDLTAYKREAAVAKMMADELLPDNLDESRFLQYLIEQAEARQIEVLAVLPDRADTNDVGLTVLPVHLQLRLDYWQLTEFLAELDKAPRFVAVRGLKANMVDGSLTCRLSLAVFAKRKNGKTI